MLAKTNYAVILVALVAAAAPAQEATQVCADGRTIKIASQWDRLGLTMPASDVATQPLRYSISKTQEVQGAWIEVWTARNGCHAKGFQSSSKAKLVAPAVKTLSKLPENSTFRTFDAEEPLICIDFCPDQTPVSGAYVSEVMAGKQPAEESDESVEPAYLMDYPVHGPPIRMVEGSGSASVALSSEDLIASSRVYLMVGDDATPNSAPSRDYLDSRTLDLRHVQVTIPSYVLRKPGMLTAYAQDSWEGKGREAGGSRNGQKIVVASKDSPVIKLGRAEGIALSRIGRDRCCAGQRIHRTFRSKVR